MKQLQHVFTLLKKEWAAYVARLKKGSLVDIAILVTAVLLVAMLLAILIFSLLKVSVSRSINEQHVPAGTVLFEDQDTGWNTGTVK